MAAAATTAAAAAAKGHAMASLSAKDRAMAFVSHQSMPCLTGLFLDNLQPCNPCTNPSCSICLLQKKTWALAKVQFNLMQSLMLQKHQLWQHWNEPQQQPQQQRSSSSNLWTLACPAQPDLLLILTDLPRVSSCHSMTMGHVGSVPLAVDGGLRPPLCE